MRVTLPLLGRMRQLMPKRLFPRALLIIILPLVLVQAMVAWFFYERHWKSVSAHMASGVVGEIMLVLDSMSTAENRAERAWLAQAAQDKLRLRVEFVGGARLSNPVRGADIDPGDYSLKDRMFAQFIARSVTYPFVIDTGSEARRLGVSIQLPDGVLHVSTRDERLYSLTINILIISMITTSIVVLFIAVLFLRNQIQRLIHPQGIFVTLYNRKPLPDDIILSAVAFSFLFFVCLAVFTLLLAMLGLDLVTSLTAAATALTNVGPGLGDIIGPAGNFEPLPDSAKWLLCFAMIMGRLELLTVMVLFSPVFWRG